MTPPHRLTPRAACAGLSAAALLAGLAACGTDPAGRGTDGERIVMGTTDQVAYLDPAAGYDPGSWLVFNNVFQSLLSFPKGGAEPVPEAAKSCAFTGDSGKVYRCTLKPGLKFTNGDPLTSKDVKFSIDRTLRINHPDGPSVLLSSISKVTTPDRRTVVFRLKTPDATFPMKIASGAGSIVDSRVYPADRLREGTTVVGSGVYELDSFSTRTAAEFSTNPDYKGPAQRHNPGLTMRFFRGDQKALAKAVRDDTVDLAYRGLAAADIARLQDDTTGGGSGDIEVVEGTSAEVQHLVFNLRDDTAGNPAVRRAVAQLIDRKALVRDAYARTAEPLYSVVPAGITGHNTAFYDRWGDPSQAKAEQILRDAGITEKIKLTLYYTPVRYGPGTAAEFAELKQQLNASGLFKATTKSVPWPEYGDRFARGDYGVYAIGWVPDFPDPDNFTAPFFGPGNVLSNHYDNPRITDDLIPETSHRTHRESTVDDFYELQNAVADDVPMLPLWQGKQYAVAHSNISGLQWTLDASTVFRFWEIRKTAD